MVETKVVEHSNSVDVHINPKLYPIEVIYSASYSFIDRSYILLNGDPEQEIIVSLTPKGESKNLGEEFLNELINYGDYHIRSKESRKMREALLSRALFIGTPKKDDFDEEEFNKLMKELEDEETEDPDQIAVPWEEKYGAEKDTDKAE